MEIKFKGVRGGWGSMGEGEDEGRKERNERKWLR